jgi:TPP-dependent pyruvate/acetoin dehydrogenase alpha subunit
MRRSAIYDPPEYVDWVPDERLLRDFRSRLAADPERAGLVGRLTRQNLLDLYAGLLRNRLHDQTLKRWVRQGLISKAWLGTGEEAATIGPVHALRRTGRAQDVVAPMIRNAGACHEMGMPVADMLRGYLATADSPSGGRDGHVGNLSRGVVPPISNVGDMVPVAAGIALAFRQTGSDRVVLTWIGDGSTKAGAFHEGFNFAAVQRLPLICIIQNNQVALGTVLERHSAGEFGQWPKMYGVQGATFDGNHVLDAYAATRLAVEAARGGAGPALLIAETFRMAGHATHDEDEARGLFDPHVFRAWGRRDPVGLYEAWLREQGTDDAALAATETAVMAEVEREAEAALASRRDRMPEPPTAATDVYG